MRHDQAAEPSPHAMVRLSKWLRAAALLLAVLATAAVVAQSMPLALRLASFALYALGLAFDPAKWVGLLKKDVRVALATVDVVTPGQTLLSYAAPTLFVASFFV